MPAKRDRGLSQKPRPASLAVITMSALALCALVLGACQQLTPEQQVEKLRSQFSVQASPFSIRETPLEVDEPTEDDEDAENADDGEIDLDAIVLDAPVKKDVLIDVLIGTESSGEVLPGLTLDIDHVDSSRELKERYLYWVDTSKVLKGSNTQVTIVIEDVDYEEGDAFSVSVRSAVPAEERSGYREFS